MRNTVFGIVAHVDAGKTTLSEELLLRGGAIRTTGRVDKGTSYLDNNEIERERGITVFTKQAALSFSGRPFTLIDTPGHFDFSGEAERVFPVLDAALLIVSASSGVNAHTIMLKRLLDRYFVPVIIFVNKTDLETFDREKLLSSIREELGDQCIEAEKLDLPEAAEDLAVLDEEIMEHYLENGKLPEGAAERLFSKGLFSPVYFGSALKDNGVDELLEGLLHFTESNEKAAKDVFSARVFSIAHPEKDRRLTFLKVTGKSLKVRDDIETLGVSEKVTEIRVYSGEKYKTVNEAHTGDIVAVAGPEKTYEGQGIGDEKDSGKSDIQALMRVKLDMENEEDESAFQKALSILSEEEPYLQIERDENSKGAYISILGPLQEEILKSVFMSRFSLKVSFGNERPLYAETISGRVEGAGHYEPLRHYAEVHLLLSEGEPGSGIVIDSACPTDVLEKTYQRQVLDALADLEREGQLRGVLTGSRLTDMRITLISGKSHVKHTEPGDFREAAGRALRHGLMRAENVLLEPVLSFFMRVPSDLVGRVLTDVSAMRGEAQPPETSADGKHASIRGILPASEIKDYPKDFSSFTKGEGSIDTAPFGFQPLANPEEVIEAFSYDPDRDIRHPSGSIFCSHGAGVFVPWDEVEDHMHIPYKYADDEKESSFISGGGPDRGESRDITAIMSTLSKSANQKSKPRGRDRDIEKKRKREAELLEKRRADEKKRPYEGREKVEIPSYDRPDLLLVDGYNIVFAWDELKSLSDVSIDAARGRLNDILSNYTAYTGCETIVVYDAYLKENHVAEIYRYNNIHIVFTATAETADQYIEKTAIKRKKDAHVSVATSDRVERMIVLSQGAAVMSAENFRAVVDAAEKEIREKI